MRRRVREFGRRAEIGSRRVPAAILAAATVFAHAPIASATVYGPGIGGVAISLNSRYFGGNAQGSWALRIADRSFLVGGSFPGLSRELGGGPVVPPPCPPDLNADGVVNTADLTIFRASIGTARP